MVKVSFTFIKLYVFYPIQRYVILLGLATFFSFSPAWCQRPALTPCGFIIIYFLFAISYASPANKWLFFSLPLFWQGGFLLQKQFFTIQAHMDAQCIVPGCIFCFPIGFQHFFQRYLIWLTFSHPDHIRRY